MMLRHATRGLLIRLVPLCALVACAAIVVALASGALAQSKPKLLPTAKATDCASCHGKTTPLPSGHLALANKKLSDCAGCHSKDGPTSLRGKLPLFHVHQLAGLGCKNCHDNPRKAEPAKSTKCLTCHAGDAIFAATARVKPRNPHGSPHYGKESDCNICHHQHEKSENFCTQCHTFEFKVP